MNLRADRRKMKRIRKWRIASSVLLLFVIVSVCYVAYSYYSGYQAAKADATLSQEEYEFDGEPYEGIMNVLLIGIDSRGEEHSNSDTIMIAQYDSDSNDVKLVSILRDTYVSIPGYQKKRKINAAFMLGGPELLRQTIKEQFDVDIHYYAIVDFNGFKAAVDAVFPEGIEIDVQQEMSKGLYVTLQPGVQNLNGKELLEYARYRGDIRSDFGRVDRQQEVLQAITDELLSVQGVMSVPKLLGTIKPYIDTNLKNKEMLSVLVSLLSSENQKIETMRIPLDGTFKDVELADKWGTRVLEVDVDENKEVIGAFLNSEK